MTLEYMPPEFISDYEQNQNSFKIDVYSFGVTLFYLIMEQLPYCNYSKDRNELLNDIKNGFRPEFPKFIDSELVELKKLIINCWNQDPIKRPSFDEICLTLESYIHVIKGIDIKKFTNYKMFLENNDIVGKNCNDIKLSNDDVLQIPTPIHTTFSIEKSYIGPIDPICTYAASGNKNCMSQKWYHCITCNLVGSQGICEVCTFRCHKSHTLQYAGKVNDNFCHCCEKGKCKCFPISEKMACTKNQHIKYQPMYSCKDCNIYICQSCAIRNHHGHELAFLGNVKDIYCQDLPHDF